MDNLAVMAKTPYSRYSVMRGSDHEVLGVLEMKVLTARGGMVIARFGRIPHVGESFDWQGWRFEVIDLDGARVDKLLVSRATTEDDG